MYINIAVHYLRQKQAVYVREAFQDAIQKLVDHPDLDLEADPCTVRVWTSSIVSRSKKVPLDIRGKNQTRRNEV